MDVDLKDYLDKNYLYVSEDQVYNRSLSTKDEVFEYVFPISDQSCKYKLEGKVSYLEIDLEPKQVLDLIKAFTADKSFYAKAIEVLSKNKHIDGFDKAGEQGGFPAVIEYIKKAYLPLNVKQIKVKW